MSKFIYRNVFFILVILIAGASFSIAQETDLSPIKTLDLDNAATSNSEVSIDLDKKKYPSYNIKNVKLVKNDFFSGSVNATDKFVQLNVLAAWDDFKYLIETMPKDDFMYLSVANKMAEFGFFDLSDLAIKKISDKSIANLSVDALKRFYYPRRALSYDDEIFLAEIYSNINFNNRSSEALNDLLKRKELMLNSDYANYLAALGYYKSDFFSNAAKYINLAIIQNPGNLNYYKLKAEILAQDKKSEDALKTVEFLKKQNLYVYEYENKVKALEQFVQYKIVTNPSEKNYHLGYYYYIENDYPKSIRVLQSALLEKKKVKKGKIFALMGEVYFSMNEYEKALEFAKKAHKMDSGDTQALMTLGNLNYMNGNYKSALHYYKKSANTDKKSYKPLIKEAMAYQKLSDNKRAKEIYTKILKTHSDCWEAYFNIGLMEPDKRLVYTKKALAVNPMFKDGWLELAKIEMDRGNYELAKTYLANVFFIDENDFRYYYLQGIVAMNDKDYNQAKYDFKKALKLNKTYDDAQIELDKILKMENNVIRQDVI